MIWTHNLFIMWRTLQSSATATSTVRRHDIISLFKKAHSSPTLPALYVFNTLYT